MYTLWFMDLTYDHLFLILPILLYVLINPDPTYIPLDYTTTQPTNAQPANARGKCLPNPSSLLFALAFPCCGIPSAAPLTCNNPDLGSVPAPAMAGSNSIPIGSYSYPNMIKGWDFLPGMKRSNGQPFYDFARLCGV